MARFFEFESAASLFPMRYLLKYSPEITIKSRPVRNRFVKQLCHNLRKLLQMLDDAIEVSSHWDYLQVTVPETRSGLQQSLEKILSDTPGISTYARVHQYPLVDFEELLRHTLEHYRKRLAGKTFAVRCTSLQLMLNPMLGVASDSRARQPASNSSIPS
jgi:thiamine biosynthesis protein ThiI